MRKVVVDVSIVPIGTGNASISEYVTEAVSLLKNEKDIKYEVTAMGTIIEGDLDRVLEIAKRMHISVFSKSVKRVLTTIKIDERTDKELSIKGKVSSVRKKIKCIKK